MVKGDEEGRWLVFLTRSLTAPGSVRMLTAKGRSPPPQVPAGGSRPRVGPGEDGGHREDETTCGAGRHTHNFSIHSPSITSVQLEAVMGCTRLSAAGCAACSRPSAAAAASQAARSTGTQRLPVMVAPVR